MLMKGRRNDAEEFERSPPEGRHDTEAGSGVSWYDRESLSENRKW